MKLIVAIVQDEDWSILTDALNEGHFNVTKLSTTGGFLRAGNTTILIGVEEKRVQEALRIIEKVCKSRVQTAAVPAPVPGQANLGGYTSYPLEVTVGGATVFVLPVDQFLKL